MDVTLFGLCLLTSEKPLYSHLIFEENGWRFWIKPVQNAVDEWEVNFVKDRGHGDEARGKLSFLTERRGLQNIKHLSSGRLFSEM